jgi:hypothetical protein
LYPHGGDSTLALARDEDRAPTLEEQIQKVLVALAYVRRHWRILIGAPAVAGVFGILSVGVFPPPNRAECTVSLDTTPPENPLERERVAHRGAEPEFFRDAATTFAEGRLVRATLAELGEPNPSEYRVRDVSEALSFTQASETLFVGSITDRDGDWALRFLRTHLGSICPREIEKDLRVYQAEVDLLNTRVQETEARLERGEAELRRFREKNLEHLPEFATNRVAAAASMESRAGELSANVARLRGELALARQRAGAGEPPDRGEGARGEPLPEALAAANRRLAELRARGLGADYPEIRQALAETENLQRQVEETTRASPTDLDECRTPSTHASRIRSPSSSRTGPRAQQEQAAVGGQPVGGRGPAQAARGGGGARAAHTRPGDGPGAPGRMLERLRQAETQLEIGRATARARYDIVAPPHTVGVAIRRTLAPAGRDGHGSGAAARDPVGGLGRDPDDRASPAARGSRRAARPPVNARASPPLRRAGRERRVRAAAQGRATCARILPSPTATHWPPTRSGGDAVRVALDGDVEEARPPHLGALLEHQHLRRFGGEKPVAQRNAVRGPQTVSVAGSSTTPMSGVKTRPSRSIQRGPSPA